MKKKQNVVASWLLIVSLFMAGSVNTMGQEYKYYDLKYEVFETDGLFYLVSDTVRVLPSGEFDPEFPNLSNSRTTRFTVRPVTAAVSSRCSPTVMPGSYPRTMPTSFRAKPVTKTGTRTIMVSWLYPARSPTEEKPTR